MKRVGVVLLVVLVSLGLSLSRVSAQQVAKKTFQYVGALKCKACHLSPASGAQFKIWQESAHAKAYEVLATPAAKEVAKKAGLSEDPQKSPKCLECHVTAYDAPPTAKAATYKMEEGVTCEACHGPGSEYWKMTTMKAIFERKVKGEEVGLVLPTEKGCTACHNQKSPTFKGFNFAEYSKKIAHPVPAAKKKVGD